MRFSALPRAVLSISPLLRSVRHLDDTADAKRLVDIAVQCPAIAPQQVYSEFIELAELVKKQKCEYVLEIGTYRGGTLFVFSQLSSATATIVSVDYPCSLRGRVIRIGQKPLFHKLVRRGQSLFLLRKDSHRPDTLAKVKELLQGHKLDFLFIDGDHSYEGVREDFRMYSPLVRSGGLLAFHDIARTKPPEEVHKLWNEIKQDYKHEEFVHRTGSGAMGIGVLWM